MENSLKNLSQEIKGNSTEELCRKIDAYLKSQKNKPHNNNDKLRVTKVIYKNKSFLQRVKNYLRPMI